MNLARNLEKSALFLGSYLAVKDASGDYTYEELNHLAGQAGAGLQALGVQPGEKVALCAPNSAQWLAFYFGALKAGAVAVTLSHLLSSRELDMLLGHSKPKVLFTVAERLDDLRDGQKEYHLDAIVCPGGGGGDLDFNQLLAKGSAPIIAMEREAGDTACILYTGGTTGVPKGAMLTHKNILFTAQNVCYHERTRTDDRGLCFLPLNHVFAGNHIMNSIFYAMGALVLHQAFDMDDILSSIEVNGVTRLYAVPTIYIRFLNNPDCHPRLRTIGYSFSAATSMPEEIVRQWRSTFGLHIHEAYGMTESSSLVTFNHRYRHKVGSVGTPAGIVQVRIADPAGRPVPQGQEGEILISGPNVMKGYYNHPEETAAALAGGWLHSGDVGRIDEDGYLHIVDRLKDMIITGGLNVYPTEVENILYQHHSVEECAVVGLPHDEYGEAVTAFILLKQGLRSREEELINFCKKYIASYKAPKNIFFVNEFPRTPQGKLLKRELRNRSMKEMDHLIKL